MNLTDLTKGQIATIKKIGGEDGLNAVLREIGFAEGDEVEILETGPLFLKHTFSVRLNRSIVALRRKEASLLIVEPQ